MADLISLREFGRRRGVQLRSVQFAIETGRIKIAETRKAGKRTRVFIDDETQAQAWAAHGDPGKRNRTTTGEAAAGGAAVHAEGKPRRGRKARGQPAAQAPAKKATPSPYQIARAARETYSAKMAEIEFKKATGALVPLEPVKSLFFTIAKHTQQNLLNIPARITPIVAAENDEKKIYAIIEKEILEALETLSNVRFDSLTK